MNGKLSAVASVHSHHSVSWAKVSGVGDVARSDVFLVCPKPWIQFPSPDKTAMVAHTVIQALGRWKKEDLKFEVIILSCV